MTQKRSDEALKSGSMRARDGVAATESVLASGVFCWRLGAQRGGERRWTEVGWGGFFLVRHSLCVLLICIPLVDRGTGGDER